MDDGDWNLEIKDRMPGVGNQIPDVGYWMMEDKELDL